MDALPTTGVWQSYGRMPEESVYVVKVLVKVVT